MNCSPAAQANTYFLTNMSPQLPAFNGGIWARLERLVREYATRYDATKDPGVCCEVDHLIPLELGGSNAVTTLWPERYAPKPGAREKDVLENFLHRAVCGGAMALEDAQRKIATDWYKAYQEMKGIQPYVPQPWTRTAGLLSNPVSATISGATKRVSRGGWTSPLIQMTGGLGRPCPLAEKETRVVRRGPLCLGDN